MRTSEAAVKLILLQDYETDLSPSSVSLVPFIDTASAVVDRVEACAVAKDKTLTAAELELIERWLSAHFYVQSDQTYASKSSAGASASFHGQTGMHLESSRYGQTALNVDFSGCLTAIGKRQTARMAWLGKTLPEQTTYEDRN